VLSPVSLFVAQALLIIVASRLLGIGARRLGQPLVIAEVVAGILLGPSLLGAVWPGAELALFPKSSLGLLGLLSQVGLILFMFLIGLELDPTLLRGRGRASVAISHSSIVVPFALGAVLALHLHADLAPKGLALAPFVLFMGAAMSITAFPVLARILVERRLLRTPIGSLTIACAAVDDVTAWCILAFVVSVARSADLGGAVRTTLLALGYIAAMILLVRPALQRIADRTRVGLSQNWVAAALVLLLISSFVTEWIGIHALFGAFLCGAILPKQGGFAAALAEKIEDLVVVLLLPLFFAYSGLRTQLGLLDSVASWLTCALVTLVACLGKFGGSTLAARLTGIGWREASAIGILMNTRGLMELIVLNIGLDLGVISPKLFAMLVIMALVTTFATTPLLARVYPIAEFGEPLAPREASGAVLARYTVLICVSFEHSGPGLLSVAAALSGTAGDSTRLYALRLLPTTNRASFVLDQQQSEPLDPERGFVPILERALALGVQVQPLSFVSSAPARDICDVAEVKQADVILLGWHKPLLGSTMLSGTVHDVMVSAKPAVGVFVDRGIRQIERILVPYVGSEHDRAALVLARRIAERTHAAVTILQILMPAGEGSSLEADTLAQDELRQLVQSGSADGAARTIRVDLRVVTHAVPAEAVLAESGHDLVLIGIGKQWGLEHRSFGLQAEAILKRSEVSVLVVRGALGAAEVRASESVATKPRHFVTVS
jgi:Kef-type K+ transport system membrane component KefB/nucleotide-binding universal stress UspA family protein